MFNFEEFLDRHKESFIVERLFNSKILIVMDVKKLNDMSSSMLYRKLIENGVNYIMLSGSKYQKIIFDYKNNTYHFRTFLSAGGLRADIIESRFDKLKEILNEPNN